MVSKKVLIACAFDYDFKSEMSHTLKDAKNSAYTEEAKKAMKIVQDG